MRTYAPAVFNANSGETNINLMASELARFFA